MTEKRYCFVPETTKVVSVFNTHNETLKIYAEFINCNPDVSFKISIDEFDKIKLFYVNGKENETYNLKIICYDDYLHQFTYDDGNGHTHVNRLKDGVKVSDFLIYDESDSKYFIVHELSDENSTKKIRVARKQLSDTLNQLYKSNVISKFIDEFTNKICFLSAKDSRKIIPTEDMAEGFNEIYRILPEPIPFNFGQIGTHGFYAFETSFVQLSK